MVWKTGRDNLACFDISYLHSPQTTNVVHDMSAHAIDSIRSEHSGIGPNAGDSVTARIDQIQIITASIVSVGRLKKRPR